MTSSEERIVPTSLVERQRRLGAARLYFVCEARPRRHELGALLRAALAGGADLIQLRDKQLDDAGLLDAAAEYRRAAGEGGALFLVNDRPELVGPSMADGVHVGQDDVPVAEARALAGPDALVGLSTHSPDQLDAACEAVGDARPDYLSVGPVWQTPTKEGRAAAGLGYVRYAAEHATVPWFAIGGIDVSNIAEVVDAGASRIVVVRAIRDSDDPRAAADALAHHLGAAERAGTD